MDEFAYNSHRKAAAATDAGLFAQEIKPFEWEETIVGDDGMPATVNKVLDQDEHLRRETTREALARSQTGLQAATATVTAGNSSPLSDGAAAVIVMEREKGGKPWS